jgi:hypothetical protein
MYSITRWFSIFCFYKSLKPVAVSSLILFFFFLFQRIGTSVGFFDSETFEEPPDLVFYFKKFKQPPNTGDERSWEYKFSLSQ